MYTVLIFLFCPLDLCFEFFLLSPWVHTWWIQGKYIQKEEFYYKYKWCQHRGSAKWDCPSLIVLKTQNSSQLVFFFVCHCFKVGFGHDCSDFVFSFAIPCNVSDFSARVTRGKRTGGFCFIDVHGVISLDHNSSCSSFWWTSLSVVLFKKRVSSFLVETLFFCSIVLTLSRNILVRLLGQTKLVVVLGCCHLQGFPFRLLFVQEQF